VIPLFPRAIILPGGISLDRPFAVIFGRGLDRYMVTVPAGTYSNFGSVPWYVRWLISPVDPTLMIAAILHDYECGEHGQPTTDWRTAAKHMRAVMKYFNRYDPAPSWCRRAKRHLVYRGVMLNGLIKGRASL